MSMEHIDYNDDAALSAALVGREIVSTLIRGYGFEKVITFVLDDGTLLKAHAADGGCACNNGCFSVDNPEDVYGTIMSVETEEVMDSEYSESGTLRLFVYTEMGRHTLVESEGTDNGYYGWGYKITVERPES